MVPIYYLPTTYPQSSLVPYYSGDSEVALVSAAIILFSILLRYHSTTAGKYGDCVIYPDRCVWQICFLRAPAGGRHELLP